MTPLSHPPPPPPPPVMYQQSSFYNCNLFTHEARGSSYELVLNLSMRSRSNWDLEVLVFEERGKPEYPDKNLSEKGREPTVRISVDRPNTTHKLATPGRGRTPI